MGNRLRGAVHLKRALFKGISRPAACACGPLEVPLPVAVWRVLMASSRGRLAIWTGNGGGACRRRNFPQTGLVIFRHGGGPQCQGRRGRERSDQAPTGAVPLTLGVPCYHHSGRFGNWCEIVVDGAMGYLYDHCDYTGGGAGDERSVLGDSSEKLTHGPLTGYTSRVYNGLDVQEGMKWRRQENGATS